MAPYKDKLVITYTKRRRRVRIVDVDETPSKKPKLDVTPTKPQLPVPAPAPTVCRFCLSSEDNEVSLGPWHEKNGVTVHYFCMLLSSGLCQNTKPSDKRSILGFTLPDIEKEIKRGKRLRCCFCHKKGATIGCCSKSCKKAFHLNCGRRHGTMHQFFDSYNSYCSDHWPAQDLGPGGSVRKRSFEICSICFMPIGKCRASQIVFPPCCKRAYFHHVCIQKYAMSAGMHFFRCPLCNSSKEFQKAMLTNGIFIPDRDASWETEPNAYEDLSERPNKCQVTPCLCPRGDNYNAHSGGFKLLTCMYCGSYSAHRNCLGLTKTDSLACPDCT